MNVGACTIGVGVRLSRWTKETKETQTGILLLLTFYLLQTRGNSACTESFIFFRQYGSLLKRTKKELVEGACLIFLLYGAKANIIVPVLVHSSFPLHSFGCFCLKVKDVSHCALASRTKSLYASYV
jgi:hypothetical protein